MQYWARPHKMTMQNIMLNIGMLVFGIGYCHWLLWYWPFCSLSSFSSRYLKLSQPSSFFLHKLCLSISNFSLNPDWSKQSNLCSQSSTVRSSWVVASLRSNSWPSYTCFHFYTSNTDTNTHENTEENTYTKEYTNTDTKKDLHHLIYAFALTAPPVNTAQVHLSFNPNILEQRV